MAKLASTTHPKARKQHPCEDCAATIPAGTTCWRVSWLDPELGFQTAAYCEACHDLARDLFEAGFVGYDDADQECYPYLPDFEYWDQVRALSAEWAARADAYGARRREFDPWFTEARS